MALWTTGPIDNAPVGSVRPTQQLTVHITNRENAGTGSVLVLGYSFAGNRVLYVHEMVTVPANGAVTRTYFANLNALEFMFEVAEADQPWVAVSVWGRDASGEQSDSQRYVTRELAYARQSN
ncbi:hypothetical protein ACE6ED_28925 [Paenibacillus sp. CN-4]|uniref:hypothetical protein n=1 Tax=Paenibacillus nanchangensis TaxID=3348343 RepID=UPI00397ADABC